MDSLYLFGQYAIDTATQTMGIGNYRWSEPAVGYFLTSEDLPFPLGALGD